jgi:hypothetical protein
MTSFTEFPIPAVNIDDFVTQAQTAASNAATSASEAAASAATARIKF